MNIWKMVDQFLVCVIIVGAIICLCELFPICSKTPDIPKIDYSEFYPSK